MEARSLSCGSNSVLSRQISALAIVVEEAQAAERSRGLLLKQAPNQSRRRQLELRFTKERECEQKKILQLQEDADLLRKSVTDRSLCSISLMSRMSSASSRVGRNKATTFGKAECPPLSNMKFLAEIYRKEVGGLIPPSKCSVRKPARHRTVVVCSGSESAAAKSRRDALLREREALLLRLRCLSECEARLGATSRSSVASASAPVSTRQSSGSEASYASYAQPCETKRAPPPVAVPPLW
jgi:hypothetical protein